MAKTQMFTILVVDDELDLTWVLAESLGREGYSVLRARSGEEALHWLDDQPVDLAILDVLMPGMDGFELCRRLRTNPRCEQIPVLFLTAKSELEHKEQGFGAGGDDYLTKPFDLLELKLRVGALLRGSPAATRQGMAASDLELDTRRRTVKVQGQPVQLTGNEFDILQRLLRHPGEVVSSKQLLVEALGYAPGTGSPATIRGHVKNLRTKLALAASSICLMTVGRSGYALASPPEREATETSQDKVSNS